MQDYDPKKRYAAGEVMVFKGRTWRSRLGHDETDTALKPDANFHCWDMLPLASDLGSAFGYCEPCNGRSVNPAGVCETCGAGAPVKPAGVLSRLLRALSGRSRT